MKHKMYNLTQLLFRVSLFTCMALGTMLVAVQLAGVILQQPEWITAGKDLLFRPTVAAAATFGVFGFIGHYLAPGKMAEAED